MGKFLQNYSWFVLCFLVITVEYPLALPRLALGFFMAIIIFYLIILVMSIPLIVSDLIKYRKIIL